MYVQPFLAVQLLNKLQCFFSVFLDLRSMALFITSERQMAGYTRPVNGLQRARQVDDSIPSSEVPRDQLFVERSL